MAIRFSVPWTASLSASTTRTLVQVTAAPIHAVEIVEFAVTFAGTNPTHAPIQVQLLTQTTAGTASAATPVDTDRERAASSDASAQTTFTAEPSASTILWQLAIHPMGGFHYQAPDPEQWLIAANTRVGLRCVTPANAVSAYGFLIFEE